MEFPLNVDVAADPPENWFHILYPKASECLLSRILALNIFLHVESAAVTCDEAMEVADDAYCRICLVFEPDPRDNEALMLLDIAEEVPNDVLVSLGCGCREELSLVHYACALKWFNIKGLKASCEVCGVSPSGISMAHRLKARRFQFRNWLLENDMPERVPELAAANDDMVARIVTFAE
ncbi:hypothetical protein L195_g044264, partial [Trifolium pratense]